MSKPPLPPPDDADVMTLVHSLQVHQAELEVQNQELTASNDELRRSNEALARARDRYRALYELAPAPLVTIDAGGTILDVNSAAERVLRTARDGLVDRRFALFVGESSRAAVGHLMHRLFAGAPVSGVELILAPDDEAPIDVLLDGVVIPADDDGSTRAVLGFVDVTARKRLEQGERLESLGVLAGGIAHDFNNLMTVVLAGTDHVLRGLGDASPMAESLTEIRQAARQAGDLAHQMLAYSGQTSAPARAVDLVALVRQLEPLIHASTKLTPVTMDLADGLPWITADEAQIRQVILNLVINAAEAMLGRSGGITIWARAEVLAEGATTRLPLTGELRPGRYVVLEVRDEGSGMDAATQARIFDPYFSTKFVGRGLGLSVVQGIVRSHRGAMTIASEVGRGTAFRVYLPAVAPAAPPRAAPPAAVWRGAGTVLIVDDEVAVRRAVARILVGLGVVVLAAADGVEAIERFRTDGARIDLVLMDLTMPRMGGVAAATAIHALRADVPIVLVTGYGEIPAGAASLFAGSLAKPFDIDGVQGVLQRLLPATKPA